MIPAPQKSSLIAALEQLGHHDHLCSIYNSEEEHFAIASPFIRIGLERNEKCLYIVDDDTIDAVGKALQTEGIDVERAIAAGTLVLATKEETYLKHGSFDPDWLFGYWNDATELAVDQGFAALRATGVTAWVLRGAAGLERWFEYESRLSHTLASIRCFALCQYDRRIFPPELISDVIRTHPMVIYRGTVCRNMYHVPPDEFVAPDQTAREVDRLLTNIRERERVESALGEQRTQLRVSEQNFRLMVESVKDYAIFMLDTEGRVISWNAGAEHCKGYREEEILGRHFSQFYTAEDVVRGEPERALRLAAAAGKIEQQGWRVRKDGGRFWADVLITALRDDAGELSGFSKLTRDITERKRAEEELRRSEAYLAEGQKLSHTGSWAWNISTGEIFWSQEHFHIFGLDPEKSTPSYEMFFEMLHPEDRQSVRVSLDRAVRERNDFENEYRIVRPDGTITYVRSLAHPAFDESGEVKEYVGTVIDITEHYEAQSALAQAFEQIKELKNRLHEENVALREEIDQRAMFEEIIGSSRAVKSVVSRIAKVAPMDCTVLITGETGTGKELVARAIHRRSNRASRAFVGFNCAGIPPSLIASELFGHEKGAFTGAQQRRLGRFELAEGSTIFLDEVGELSAETQIALLRVIQEREFERVGGSQAIATDVRVIAATNRDLQDAVAAGSFRLDLFYRLNVFPIEVPPLRDRRDDIPLLLEYFVKRYADKAGKKMRSIDSKAVELFKAYHWPGNIRELQNVVERSVIVCDSEVFSIDPSWLSTATVPTHGHGSTLAERLHEQETKIIETALADSNGKIAGRFGAATKLGIPSSTLESKIKLLKIGKNRFKSA
ncbi:MAG TPA: sigma 54-interacting transcriptional regulator [Candidatus Binatia bacterium]